MRWSGRWIFPRPAQRADLLSRIKEIVRKGERLENIETPIRCKDGQRKVILWHTSDLVDAKGNLTGGVILAATSPSASGRRKPCGKAKALPNSVPRGAHRRGD